MDGVYDALKHNRKAIDIADCFRQIFDDLLCQDITLIKSKILLVVPTTSLVEQMYKDFQDYGWDSESYCHSIYSGKEKQMNIQSQLQHGSQYIN